MLRTFVAGVGLLFVMACQPVLMAPPPTSAPTVSAGPRLSGTQAMANYTVAVARVEPVAEQMCRTQARGINCDYLIRVDPDASKPSNAFQSLDSAGRPVLTFTQALIRDARNEDEIAFVLGHESAHHIEQHLARQQQAAVGGAIVGSILGSLVGADATTVEQLGRAGASVGALRFSKDHELEADALGTIITHRAGYDPVRGAEFFTRIPDPGDRFLGTHPPNADRIATVRRVAAGL
jgi:Zn-dependent protease with chaperone function